MTSELACPQCSQVISPEDTVEFSGDHVVHFDCRLPQRLSREERALLLHYCWDHPVAECVPCVRNLRQNELLWGPIAGSMDRCPRCREDMTESMRAHLYSCARLPAEVRQRAQEIRASSQKLVKHAGELLDRADVLMREAEALTARRDAMKQLAFERLRRVIRIKLRDGSLPHDDIPATIPGCPGDDSACGACDHLVTSPDLMMVVMRDAFRLSALHEATPIPFHADCFELWNEERRLFKPVIPPPS